MAEIFEPITQIFERFAGDPVEILLDSLVLGFFQDGPLVLAAIGFTFR